MQASFRSITCRRTGAGLPGLVKDSPMRLAMGVVDTGNCGFSLAVPFGHVTQRCSRDAVGVAGAIARRVPRWIWPTAGLQSWGVAG